MSASTGRAAYYRCIVVLASQIGFLAFAPSPWRGLHYGASSISGPFALTIGPDRHLAWSVWRIIVRELRVGTTGHNDSDQDEEQAHGDWPYQHNVAWLWQRCQTSVNIRRLTRIALRRAASASRPAQFCRSRFVFSVGGQFHNSALSESSFEGFITTICQVCALADPHRCQ